MCLPAPYPLLSPPSPSRCLQEKCPQYWPGCPSVCVYLRVCVCVSTRPILPVEPPLPLSLSTGEVPPVLAERTLRQVPVLRRRPDGRVQHAAVHPAGVQGHRRTGELLQQGGSLHPLGKLPPLRSSSKVAASQLMCWVI